MRSVVFQIGVGVAAAAGFLLVLLGLGTAGVAVLSALVFLTVHLVNVRVSAQPKPVRIRSDR